MTDRENAVNACMPRRPDTVRTFRKYRPYVQNKPIRGLRTGIFFKHAGDGGTRFPVVNGGKDNFTFMVKTWKLSIPELTGREKRRAYLYLPTMYREQPRRRFPVLYMFDGHNVFFDDHATHGKSWGLAEYLDFFDVPVIVAAVECNHHPDNGRLSEYSPYDFSDPEFGSVTGRGHKTMEWLVHTFKASIDRRYRTIPWRESTFIAGSSMGGLMSLYAVTKYNEIFSRAAALSPHIWADRKKLLSLIRSAPLFPDTVVYMDWGSEEFGGNRSMEHDLRLVADALFDRGVHLTARVVPGGEHSEASWEKQAPFFMSTLMYGLEG